MTEYHDKMQGLLQASLKSVDTLATSTCAIAGRAQGYISGSTKEENEKALLLGSLCAGMIAQLTCLITAIQKLPPELQQIIFIEARYAASCIHQERFVGAKET